uniref:complement factor B-like n=1 Tax=Pristiophorus japonicus TaxID=55135 RepID=UPI00398F379F
MAERTGHSKGYESNNIPVAMLKTCGPELATPLVPVQLQHWHLPFNVDNCPELEADPDDVEENSDEDQPEQDYIFESNPPDQEHGQTSHSFAHEEQLCSNEEVIKGGRIEWPENRVERSVMTYICPDGFRPYPVSSRYCMGDNNWSQLRNIYGETALEATCKEITCLAPKYFDFGTFDPPMNTYKVNASVTFECFNGYQLIGSVTRTCLANGQWSGNLPRCYTEDTFCPNPGIPFGARKIGTYYRLFSTVQYNCGKHILRGSKERRCLESGRWSGVESRCESKYAFDSVERLAKELDILESIIRNADLDSGTVQNRRVDVFFVVDVSKSVGIENFSKSLNFVKNFINRVSDVGTVRFEVVAFGSNATTITAIKDILPPKAVIEKIKRVEYR